MADQEKLQQEREKENLKVAELMLETVSEQVSSPSSYSDAVSDIVDTSPGSTIEAIKVEGINRIEEAPILEPVRIQYGPLIPKGNINKQTDFNFSEFEDNSATPFELVELQTLDDIDELKSVLQPNSVKTAKSINSNVTRPNTKTADDIDFSIFNAPVTASNIKTSAASPVVTGSLLQGLETEESHLPQNAALSSESQGAMYQENLPLGMTSWGNSAVLTTCSAYENDALSYTSSPGGPILPLERRFEYKRFNKENKGSSYSKRFNATFDSTSFLPPSIASAYLIQAPAQSTLPFIQTSDFHAHQYRSHKELKMLEFSGNAAGPVCNGPESSYVRSTQIVDQNFANKCDMSDFGIERTNLNKTSSKSLPNLADASLVTDSARSDDSWSKKHRRLTTEASSPIVSTSRIDNIMKQFQLNRLREFDEVPTTTDATIPSETSSVQTSMTPDVNVRLPSRHGILPSLETSPRNIPYPPISSPPHDNSLHASEKQCLSDDESSRRFGHLEVFYILCFY